MLNDRDTLFQSGFVREVQSFLRDIGIKSQFILHPVFERIMLETDGNFFYHFNFVVKDAGLENYQLSALAADNNLSLIHLWEDLWFTKREIVESRIKSLYNKLDRIHGRETEVRTISNEQLLTFLEHHHLSVPIKGRFRFGLFHKGTLVAVLSVSSPKKFTMEEPVIYSYEILRFCHKSNLTVVGGLTKLLQAFINDRAPDHLMTYIDQDWGTGKGFLKHGFQLEGSLLPTKFLIDPHSLRRYHASFQAPTLKELPGGTDFVPVFNAGSIKLTQRLNG